MGGALDAFGVMGGAMKRNPVLLAGAAVVGVASTVLNTSNQVPLLGWVVGFLYFFVEPFLAGGYLGMANEAVDGEATFGDFVSAGTENFADLLVARLVVAIPFVVYLFAVVLVGGFVVGLSAMSVGGAASDPAPALGAVSVVGMLVFLFSFVVYAVPFFFLQFYPAAIVVGGADALESFAYSYKLVRAHPLSALGYTAFVFALGFLLVVPGLLGGGGQIAGRVLGETVLGTGGGVVTGFAARIAVFVVVFVAVKTLVVYVARTYYVAFVRSVTNTV